MRKNYLTKAVNHELDSFNCYLIKHYEIFISITLNLKCPLDKIGHASVFYYYMIVSCLFRCVVLISACGDFATDVRITPRCGCGKRITLPTGFQGEAG